MLETLLLTQGKTVPPPVKGDITFKTSSTSATTVTTSELGFGFTTQYSIDGSPLIEAGTTFSIPAGDHIVTLKLDVTAFNSLNMSPFKDILTEVTDWEGFQLRNIQFFNSTNLTKVPDYLPSSIRSMARMFYGCTSFNQDLSSMIFESTVNNSFYAEGATAWNPAYRPKFTG